MKKRLVLVLALCGVIALAGCGKKEEEKTAEVVVSEPTIEVINDAPAITIDPNTQVEDDGNHDGEYRNELSNQWTNEELKDQRPIAVMIDNEKTALPHYGLSKADVVYEMTNSLANDGITRLMALFKDYESIDQIGSIRSTRPTNLVIAPEWNAIVCHDGGPFYIDDYIAKPYVNNFSGTFSRVDNGKSREFTEYILPGDMEKNFSNSNVSKTYNEYYKGEPHFKFAEGNSINTMADNSSARDCTSVELPFKHNGSKLKFDVDSRQYMYSEYGEDAHIDPAYNNEPLGFTNVIIQNCRYVKFDDNGYMMFHAIDYNRDGWFITAGKCIEITWSKEDEVSATRYYDKYTGEEVVLNTGKTYIALVPDDSWDGLVIH